MTLIKHHPVFRAAVTQLSLICLSSFQLALFLSLSRWDEDPAPLIRYSGVYFSLSIISTSSSSHTSPEPGHRNQKHQLLQLFQPLHVCEAAFTRVCVFTLVILEPFSCEALTWIIKAAAGISVSRKSSGTNSPADEKPSLGSGCRNTPSANYAQKLLQKLKYSSICVRGGRRRRAGVISAPSY